MSFLIALRIKSVTHWWVTTGKKIYLQPVKTKLSNKDERLPSCLLAVLPRFRNSIIPLLIEYGRWADACVHNIMIKEWENFQNWAIQPVNSQEAFVFVNKRFLIPLAFVWGYWNDSRYKKTVGRSWYILSGHMWNIDGSHRLHLTQKLDPTQRAGPRLLKFGLKIMVHSNQ